MVEGNVGVELPQRSGLQLSGKSTKETSGGERGKAQAANNKGTTAEYGSEVTQESGESRTTRGIKLEAARRNASSHSAAD